MLASIAATKHSHPGFNLGSTCTALPSPKPVMMSCVATWAKTRSVWLCDEAQGMTAARTSRARPVPVLAPPSRGTGYARRTYLAATTTHDAVGAARALASRSAGR
jgi:hypothetical protein